MNLRQNLPPIPFIDVAAQRRRLGPAIDGAIARVLDHCQFVLGPEVRAFEPALALTAGVGRLFALAFIVREAPRHLLPGGMLALETGTRQRAELAVMAAAAGFSRVESRQDLTGRDRATTALRP